MKQSSSQSSRVSQKVWWQSLVTRLWSGTLQQCLLDFDEWVEHSDACRLVFTPNPEQVVQALHRAEFREVLLQADRLLPDGVGVVWAARRTARRNLVRIAGVEVVQAWLARQSQSSKPVRTLLIGGRGEVAQHVAERFDRSHALAQQQSTHRIPAHLREPWCRGVEGIRHVRRYDRQFLYEEEALRSLIRRWHPEIIFVGFGAPYQELWLARQCTWLSEHGVKVAMVCGGAFDMISGALPRAPQFVRDLGLEWLYRLWKEPRRWRRQLQLIRFVMWVVFPRWDYLE